MAHQATLKFKDHDTEYTINDINYTVTCETSKTGHPNKRPEISPITMILVATDNSDLFFYEWMSKYTGEGSVKECTIKFKVVSKGKISTKTLFMQDVHPISLRENFNFHDDKQMTVTLSIVCQYAEFFAGENTDKEQEGNVRFWRNQKAVKAAEKSDKKS